MINTLSRLVLCVSMLAVSSFAQDKSATDLFKKEAAPLQAAVEEAVNSAAPGMGVVEHAKATYLDGYGLVVTVEAALVPPRNPFTSQESPAQVRSTVTQRRTAVQQKLERVLKEQSATLKSLGPEASLSVVLYLINSNPADLPDLPRQIVFTVKKTDQARVTIREF
jgi:hypothetical protein